MKARKFILIDDNNAFREALKKLLTLLYDAQILAEASTMDEIEKITSWNDADIVFMDVMMPGKDGIMLTKDLIWEYDKINVVAVTMHFEKVYLTSIIEAGFKGCIFKSDLVNQIGKAIEVVSDGDFYFPDNIILDKLNPLKLKINRNGY